MTPDEVTALDDAVRTRPERREAQRALAYDVTARVHGEETARVATEVSALLFEKSDPSNLSANAIRALQSEIPFATYAHPEDSTGPAESIDVMEALVQLGLAASRGAAKRLMEQGGVSVNGAKVPLSARFMSRDRALHGRYFLVKKVARDYGLLSIEARN